MEWSASNTEELSSDSLQRVKSRRLAGQLIFEWVYTRRKFEASPSIPGTWTVGRYFRSGRYTAPSFARDRIRETSRRLKVLPAINSRGIVARINARDTRELPCPLRHGRAWPRKLAESSRHYQSSRVHTDRPTYVPNLRTYVCTLKATRADAGRKIVDRSTANVNEGRMPGDNVECLSVQILA